MKTFIKHLFFAIVTVLMLVAQVNFVYAQTAGLLLNGVQQFFDNNGNPLSQGTVGTYIPGTFTNKTTWQDQNETTPNPNPIILDAAGRATIYGVGIYRQVVKDKSGNQIWDAVTQPGGISVNQLLVGDGQPVGTIKPWAGINVPAQYLYAAGQTLSRTTYASLFNAITIVTDVSCTASSSTFNNIADTTQIPIGATVEIPTCLAAPATVTSKTSSSVTLTSTSLASTVIAATFFPYGDGNGSTTFALPDFRGVILAGRPNMGGSDKGNLTTTYYGTNPDGLNATGGNESSTLAQTNLPNVNFPNNLAISISGSQTISGIFASGGSNNFVAQSGVGNGFQSFTINGSSFSAAITSGAVSSGGSGTAFSLIQPTTTINYIIKVLPDVSTTGGSVVNSLNNLIGDINLVAGTNITLTPSGQNLTIAATATINSFAPGSTIITGATAPCFLVNSAGTTSICDALGTGVVPAMSNNVNNSGGLLTYGIIGTSGSTIGLLNSNKTDSGTNVFNGVNTFSSGITGLPIPVSSTDAANKFYVDSVAQGLTIHPSAVLATTTALAANTYNNGTAGVGATLTANANGNLVIDGSTNPSTNTRIIVKNESTAANNGIYVVTTTGGASQAWVLTRATDADIAGTDDPNKIGAGTYVLITSGTVNINSSWIVTSSVATIGTDAINWSQFSSSFNGVISLGGNTGVIGLDSTLQISGGILGFNLANTNIWTGAQTCSGNIACGTWTISGSDIHNNNAGTITLNGATTVSVNNAAVILNASAIGNSTFEQFNAAGTGYWQYGLTKPSGGSNATFFMSDLTRGGYDITIPPNGDMKLMQSGGNVIPVGNLYIGGGAPWVDVKSGANGCAAAVGNGSTNDQAAVQCQIHYMAVTFGGGIVFFPCGSYLVNGGITVEDGDVIIGEGAQCTSLGVGDDEIALQFSATNRGTDQQGVQSITINCVRAVVTSNCVYIDGSNVGPGGYFDHVHIFGGNCALETNNLVDWYFYDVFASGFGATGATNGGGGCNLYSLNSGNHYLHGKFDGCCGQSISFAIEEIATVDAGGDTFTDSDSVASCVNGNSNVCVYVSGAGGTSFHPSWVGSEVAGLYVQGGTPLVTVSSSRVDGLFFSGPAGSTAHIDLISDFGAGFSLGGAGTTTCYGGLNISGCNNHFP